MIYIHYRRLILVFFGTVSGEMTQRTDANSKFFHGILGSRRRGNNIPLILVNGTSVEGLAEVRSVVFDHFVDHFKVHIDFFTSC